MAEAKPPAVPEERRDASGLTPRMKMGAYFEAKGLNREEIAQALDVHETSVSRWRREEVYRKEVAGWQSREIEKFEALIGRYRFRAFEAAMSAIAADVEALEAVTGEGDPDWATRQRASDGLKQHAGMLLGAFSSRDPEASKASAAAAVTIIVKREGEEIEAEEAEYDSS